MSKSSAFYGYNVNLVYAILPHPPPPPPTSQRHHPCADASPGSGVAASLRLLLLSYFP